MRRGAALFVTVLAFGSFHAGSAEALHALCDGGAVQDRQLYFLDTSNGRRCFRAPTFVPGGEYSRIDTPVERMNAAPGPRMIDFIYAAAGRTSASGVVVKERYYRPGFLLNDPGQGMKADPQATDQVWLSRGAVANECGEYPEFASKTGSSFREYNRFHENPDLIPRDDFVKLHYRYPVSNTCRRTDDRQTGNARQFKLEGVEIDEQGDFGVLSAFIPRLISRAFAARVVNNRSDVFMRVQNLYWPQGASDPSVLSFKADAIAGTRLEVTVGDLEHRIGPLGPPQPQRSWQLDVPR